MQRSFRQHGNSGAVEWARAKNVNVDHKMTSNEGGGKKVTLLTARLVNDPGNSVPGST